MESFRLFYVISITSLFKSSSFLFSKLSQWSNLWYICTLIFTVNFSIYSKCPTDNTECVSSITQAMWWLRYKWVWKIKELTCGIIFHCLKQTGPSCSLFCIIYIVWPLCGSQNGNVSVVRMINCLILFITHFNWVGNVKELEPSHLEFFQKEIM